MNYTLITGASRGIGRALAKEFARFNCHLFLTARSQQELEELAAALRKEFGIKVEVLALDLLAEGAAETLYQHCIAQNINVRILVNNAGMGLWDYFEEARLQDMLRMMQLNQQVLITLCHLFLPMLKKMPEAHIMNVSSTAAFQPFPGFSVYAASKAFVYSFSQSLRFELKKDVNVTCLCPGPTDTTFFSNAGFNHRLDTAEGLKMSVDEVAQKAVEGLLAKKAVLIPGFSNKIGGFFSKLLPTPLTTNLLGRIVQYRKS